MLAALKPFHFPSFAVFLAHKGGGFFVVGEREFLSVLLEGLFRETGGDAAE